MAINTTLPSDTLPLPVSTQQAWHGPEMADSDEWIFTLTGAHIAEIEAAMRPLVAHGADIAQIVRSDFPLPTLGRELESLRHDILEGRGFTLIRGLPVERYTIEEAATAYFGIGTWFGSARSQNAKGHVLGHVRDLGRDAINDPTARTYQSRQRQTFHTDSCDIVGLLCLKTAKSGGLSAIVSSMTIYNDMYKRRPDLLQELFAPFAVDRRGEVPAGKLPYYKLPIFHWYQGYLSAIYSRRYIDSAQRFSEVPAFTATQIEALDLLDEMANDPEINLYLTFQPGDIQLLHNHTMLHDRTAYEDWPEPERQRHLLRLWLAAPKRARSRRCTQRNMGRWILATGVALWCRGQHSMRR